MNRAMNSTQNMLRPEANVRPRRPRIRTRRHDLRRQAALCPLHRIDQHRRHRRRPRRRSVAARRTAPSISPMSKSAGRGRGDHGWHLRRRRRALRQRPSASANSRVATRAACPWPRALPPPMPFAPPPVSHCRSALAQRSAHRPAQNRRHSRRGKNSNPKACPTQWSWHRHQRAPAHVSAGSRHARNLARPRSRPSTSAANRFSSPC